jgi:O-acetyl-ADP-ribose deacetylase (regulator of RNase III)
MACQVTFIFGDITAQEVDALVNAANSGLAGGGGVDGAIHRQGGPTIMQECDQIRARQGGCPPGRAVVTGAGQLPAKHVIHAVGPIWQGGTQGEDETLRQAYWHSLALARGINARTVAFPSISTGAYRFPIKRAARVALQAVRDWLEKNGPCLQEVRFVLFKGADLDVYRQTWQELIQPDSQSPRPGR